MLINWENINASFKDKNKSALFYSCTREHPYTLRLSIPSCSGPHSHALRMQPIRFANQPTIVFGFRQVFTYIFFPHTFKKRHHWHYFGEKMVRIRRKFYMTILVTTQYLVNYLLLGIKFAIARKAIRKCIYLDMNLSWYEVCEKTVEKEGIRYKCEI